MKYSMSKIGFVPLLLLSSFTLLYLTNLFDKDIYSLALGGLAVFAGVILYLGDVRIKAGITKSSLLTALYFLVLLIALSLANLFSLNPSYSFARGVISVTLYFVLFFIYKRVGESYIKNVNWRIFLAKTFTLILIIILGGQVLMADWKMGVGGVRLTGGTNPNYVSFLAFFIVFISHFNGLLNKKWLRIDKVNWVLAILVMLWSMSRSGLLGLGVFYSIYFGWYFIRDFFDILLRGKVRKGLIKEISIVTLLFFFASFVLMYFSQTNFYKNTILRFTGEEGLSMRASAWEILMSYFKQNPLFGGVGWWNASNTLPYMEGVAKSPHSLYVRLLSEVGLVGTIAVLALPIFIILGLFVRSYKEKDALKEKKMMIVSSFLMGIFVIQFFEDKFLTGFFGLSNVIIIWSIAFGYLMLTEGSNRQKPLQEPE